MTENELLAALEEAFRSKHADEDGALTSREVADAWGCQVPTARERIRLLIAQGRAECVRVPRAGIDGVVQPTRAYRLKAA